MDRCKSEKNDCLVSKKSITELCKQSFPHLKRHCRSWLHCYQACLRITRNTEGNTSETNGWNLLKRLVVSLGDATRFLEIALPFPSFIGQHPTQGLDTGQV